MLPGRLTKSRADRQPILSLVDREYLKSTANIPRGMWEPMSYLYSEADKSLLRIEAMEIPSEAQMEEMVAALKVRNVKVQTEETVLPRSLWDRLLRRPAVVEVRAKEVGPVEWVSASEAAKAKLRGDLATLPQVKESTVKKWHQVLGWLDELLIQSASVEALRSWQLMTGLQAQNGQQARPSAAIMPDFPQPQAPGQPQERRKRGVRLP